MTVADARPTPPPPPLDEAVRSFRAFTDRTLAFLDRLTTATREPDPSPSGLAAAWVARVAVLRTPPLRRIPDPPTELMADIAALIEQCRTGDRRPLLGRLIGGTVPADVGTRLGRVADWFALYATDARPWAEVASLHASVDVVLGRWRQTGCPEARLADIAARLDALAGPPAGFPERWDMASVAVRVDEWLGAIPDAVRTKLPPLVAAGLAIAVRAIAECRRQDDWSVVSECARDWISGFGLTVEFGQGPAPVEKAVLPLAATGLPGGVWVRLQTVQRAREVPRETPAVDPITAVWRDLPTPDALGITAAPPLTAWWVEVQAGRPANLDASRGVFAEWVQTPAGRDWFHQLLTAAMSDGPARRWWAALRGTGWCQSFPDVDPTTGTPRWPEGTEPPWPAASSRPAEAPPGRVLEVMRFAPDAASSRFVVSDGPVGDDSAAGRLTYLVSALTAAGMEDALQSGRWEQARRLALGLGTPSDNVTTLLEDWLDRLTRTTDPTPAARGAYETVLTALREWAARYGLTVLPTGWTYARPVRVPELAADEATTSLAFREQEPAGTVLRVRQFGWARDGSRGRDAILAVSAGKAPAGYGEMEQLLKGVGSPEADRLREQLHGWRTAGLGGYLPEAAVQFFVDFWGEAGDPLRATAPDVAQQVADLLSRAMTDTFGLTVFLPMTIHDHPEGWLVKVTGHRSATGRVRAVHRPGLADRDGQLRIPAVVEVE